jgi:hypothetical protein
VVPPVFRLALRRAVIHLLTLALKTRFAAPSLSLVYAAHLTFLVLSARAILVAALVLVLVAIGCDINPRAPFHGVDTVANHVLRDTAQNFDLA